MDRLFLEMMSVMLNAMMGFGMMIIALQLMKFWHSHKAQQHAERVERTMKALQLPENVSKVLEAAFRKHQQGGSLSEDELWSSGVFAALNFFENIATGIREGVYDERISYNRLGDALPRFYSIVASQLYRSRGEGLSPSLYVELEGLVRSWSDRPRASNFGEL